MSIFFYAVMVFYFSTVVGWNPVLAALVWAGLVIAWNKLNRNIIGAKESEM